MNRHNAKMKMPFSVSLALIFGYSLLLVMVPTRPEPTNATIATQPDRPFNATHDEQIVSTNSDNQKTSKPTATIH